jgi:hypothetical protein
MVYLGTEKTESVASCLSDSKAGLMSFDTQ